MWNLQDDKELDKLSRDAAENYSLDQSPDSWNNIHLRLDAEMPGERRRRYLLFFLFFLFIGSGIFWLTRMNMADDISKEIAGKPFSQDNELVSSEEVKDQTAANKPASPGTGARIQPSNAGEIKSPPAKSESVTDDAKAPISNGSNAKPPRIVNQKPSGKVVATKDAKNKKNNRNGVAVVGVTEIQNQVNPEKKNQVVTNGQDAASKDDITPIVSNDAKKADAQPSTGNDAKDQAVIQEQASAQKVKAGKNKVNTKWTLAATYAPDVSTVNFTHSQPIGLNLGLMVEYALSKKFSLQTGLIYTKKNYKMKGEDYHPPKGYWTDYVNLEDVTGNCQMLDIPINVRFNAVRKKSSNIFFSAGLSTYLMKEENYSFFYYWNGTPTTRVRGYDANSEYLFSILNLSVGYEKKLTNAFSLQVEPFFKESLTGVGFGEIDLNSMGVYFSVRYNPLRTVKQSPKAKK